MTRSDIITSWVKRYDSKLFCKHNGFGFDAPLALFRKGKKAEVFYYQGQTIVWVKDVDHLVFCLTDNWSIKGKPVDWGLEPIRARLVAMDLWNRHTFMDELEAQDEKDKASSQRAFKNTTESFLKDFRRQFARATNDVNTGNLAKIDKRRLKNGYY